MLRTGISPGADEAFFRGARAAAGRVELYLPWPDFQADVWSGTQRPEVRVLRAPSPAGQELAARFHPHWRSLAPRERLLLARDGHEVLGADLASPARFVVCWTAEGSLDGSSLTSTLARHSGSVTYRSSNYPAESISPTIIQGRIYGSSPSSSRGCST